MRVRKKILWSFLFVVALGAIGWVLAAGVTVAARNRSALAIDNLVIGHDRGELRMGAMTPGAEKSEFVGKIGEGTTFWIGFEQEGHRLESTANVYFPRTLFRTEIVIEIGEGHRVRVLSEDVVLDESVAETR